MYKAATSYKEKNELKLLNFTHLMSIYESNYYNFKSLLKRVNTRCISSIEHSSIIIKDIQHDKQKLMTHIYVNHMGHLSGGQMLMKKIPGSGKMYKFEDMGHSVDEMKNLIRKRVSEDDAIEANIGFGYRLQQYEQLNAL